MELEQRIEDLAKRIAVAKVNPCHVKSGPQGGQFCETKGGGSGAGSSGSAGGSGTLGSTLSTSTVVSAWGPKMQESPFRSRTGPQNRSIIRDAGSMEKAGFTLHEKGASKGTVVVTPKIFVGSTPTYSATVSGKEFGAGKYDAANWPSLRSALKTEGHLK